MLREGLRLFFFESWKLPKSFRTPLLNRPENGVLKGRISLSTRYIAIFWAKRKICCDFFKKARFRKSIAGVRRAILGLESSQKTPSRLAKPQISEPGYYQATSSAIGPHLHSRPKMLIMPPPQSRTRPT